MTLRQTWIAMAATVLLASCATAQTASSAHHHGSATPARKAAKPVAAAVTEPGLAAVGTMPAVAGPVHTLYALRYVNLQAGTGELAQPNKFYTVHYTGWLTDGTKFDSSVDRGEPIPFFVGARRVIIGWDTGFEGMHVGGKRRLIIPYQLAYGEAGRPPIPPKADLIFDIELLAQSDTPPQQTPPPAPAGTNPAPSSTGTTPKPATQPGTNPVTKPADKPE